MADGVWPMLSRGGSAGNAIRHTPSARSGVSTFETIGSSPIAWVGTQLACLPPQPLRRAVVLVQAERQAHAIRRHLCVTRQEPQLLAGVLFLRPAQYARELLTRAGRVRIPGWEDLRRLRLVNVFDSGALAGRLRYFTVDQLGSGPGYVEAFTRAIADLESSGLDPSLARTVAERIATTDRRFADRLHDVAIIWEAADNSRGAGRTASQLLTEAAEVAASHPDVTDQFGTTFAVLTVSPSTVLLRFLQALPGCRTVLQDARPWRTGTQRWRELIATTGEGAASVDETDSAAAPRVESPAQTPSAVDATRRESLQPLWTLHSGLWTENDTRTELGLVQRFLFALPEELTDPGRPRSSGPDGSVDLEEYPSVEDEIEAAATWVAEQIIAGTPLEQIAVVVPEVDAYAPWLADRLARLAPDPAPVPVPVHVADGLPLTGFAAGRLLFSLLDAVSRGLEAEATIRLLPVLRRSETDAGTGPLRLSPSRAAEIVYGAGILGGTPGDPTGVAEWVPRLTDRWHQVRDLLDAATGVAARERAAAQRWLRDVEPILPAISELQQFAEQVVAGASFAHVWHSFRAFCERRLRVPQQPANVIGLLERRLQVILQDPVAQRVTGFSAVRFLMDLLASERHSTTRFGEPCVFVGTAAQASGLPFTAVRVLGLAEGVVPHTAHDDPIVPDGLRRLLETACRQTSARADIVIPHLADGVLDELHDVFRVIAGAREHLSLSAPRHWIDHSEREVSGILLEAATALSRTAGATAASDVPTAARLRAVYLNIGCAARVQAAAKRPLTPRAVLATAAQQVQVPVVPAHWMGNGPLAVDAIRQRIACGDSDALGALDGMVGEVWAGVPAIGVVRERPISASALHMLLRCPHRFLLQRILYLSEPPAPPPADAIDPEAYGALFHTAAERFFQEAGPALCRRHGRLEQWEDRARAIADQAFDKLRNVYPMRSADGIARERNRLRRQTEQLVRYEWHLPPREFLASELPFGTTQPVALRSNAGDLYVWGKIDRIDRLGAEGLAVRDLKTGRARDFGEEPINATRDLQIGVYVLALEASGYGGTPVGVAAYVYPSALHTFERGFAGSRVEVLRRHTRGWIGIARHLLSVGLFPRTPNADDCRQCPFVPNCGPDATQRAARKLRALKSAHPLGPFARFKAWESQRMR